MPSNVSKNDVARTKSKVLSYRDREAEAIKKLRASVVQEAALMYNKAVASSLKGKAPHNTVPMIIETLKAEWLNRDIIYYAVKKYRKENAESSQVPDFPDEIEVSNNSSSSMSDDLTTYDSETIASSTTKATKGGRPVGSSNLSKDSLKRKLDLFKDTVCEKYALEKEKAKSRGQTKVPKHTYKKVCLDVAEQIGMPDTLAKTVARTTIVTRIKKNNFYGFRGSYSQSSMLTMAWVLLC